MKRDASFRHESLQSNKTVKALLEALTKGVGKGSLTLGDGDEEVTLEPDGLLTLRVRADRSDGNCRLELRMTWSEEGSGAAGKPAPTVR